MGIEKPISNLLTPIISYCQLAQQSPDDARIRQKAIDKSLDMGLRAAAICESILGFSHSDDEQRTCGVSQVVDGMLGCLARPPAKDGVSLTVDIAEGVEAAIAPIHLHQVLSVKAYQSVREFPVAQAIFFDSHLVY